MRCAALISKNVPSTRGAAAEETREVFRLSRDSLSRLRRLNPSRASGRSANIFSPVTVKENKGLKTASRPPRRFRIKERTHPFFLTKMRRILDRMWGTMTALLKMWSEPLFGVSVMRSIGHVMVVNKAIAFHSCLPLLSRLEITQGQGIGGKSGLR